MTDETRPAVGPAPGRAPARPERGTQAPGGAGKRPRHAARGSRIAAAGVGVAAMVGLVSSMQVSSGQAQSPATVSPSTAWSARGTVATRYRAAVSAAQTAALRRPIVLTPHAVVRTVNAPAAASYSSASASAYAAAAPAPVAAPVASSGGSHP